MLMCSISPIIEPESWPSSQILWKPKGQTSVLCRNQGSVAVVSKFVSLTADLPRAWKFSSLGYLIRSGHLFLGRKRRRPLLNRFPLKLLDRKILPRLIILGDGWHLKPDSFSSLAPVHHGQVSHAGNVAIPVSLMRDLSRAAGGV